MKFVLVCNNPDCKLHDIPIEAGKYTMKYDRETDRMIPKLEQTRVCSKCGSQLVFKEAENNIPDFSVSSFRGLPDDKKKEILRQRFDKEIKRGAGDEREQRKRNAMSKMLGYGN